MEDELRVGYGYSVDVTHINDPHSFYVRSVKVKDILGTIESPGSPVPENLIKYGQYIIFKSNILQKYVRGELLSIDFNKAECVIFAMDYGYYEYSVSLKAVYHPEKEQHILRPPLAYHCRLHLCEPIGGNTFTQKVIDAMKNFIGIHTASVNVMSKLNQQLIVELITEDCPRDVSTMLGLYHFTTFTKPKTDIHHFQNSSATNFKLTQTLSYKEKKLKVGDVLQIRVLSGTSLSAFYVAQINEYKEVIKDQQFFTMHCKNRRLKDEDIVPGLCCAVKVGHFGEYKRAIVQQIIEPNSRAAVQLVDWGENMESYFSSIRSVVSEHYFAQPKIAIYCSTDEEQAWYNDLPRFLFPGYEFQIKIMELGNNSSEPHKVNIYPLTMVNV